MANIKSTYSEVRIPLVNMSFTPDIPPTSLQPNEYNVGTNVETDVRGIRSVLGDQQILSQLSGTPVYVTGGYRNDGNFYYIVATVSSSTQGRWYQVSTTSVTNITPGYAASSGAYLPNYSTNINITEAWNGTALIINDGENVPMFLQGNATEFEQYKLQADSNISNLTWAASVGTVDITSAPLVAYAAGDKITIQDAYPPEWNGDYVITTVNSTTSFDFAVPTNPGSWNNGGTLRPTYQWNYNPDWNTLKAGFMRVFSSPNVGSLLIAGNLTATDSTPSTFKFPNTVRWSQNFALNEVPRTWAPTITNVANELEVPCRGPVLDGYPCNGSFFIASYWDTTVFSPIAYQTTQVPIFGVRLFNQGRGLLNSNCWVNSDDMVYGVDARDLWVFDGQNFKPLGNQRVKNYFFYNLAPQYTNQVFMEINSQKNQVELYYPEDGTSTGYCNKMLSYRYDLDIFNAPRDVPNVIMACEAPVFRASYGNIFDPGSRTVSFVRAVANTYITEKDQGFAFLSGNIASLFQRDAIHLSDEYSTQTMVHRILPEAVNINDFGLPTTSVGNITITVGGSDSPGQTITYKPSANYQISSGNTWVQVDQNVYRLNSLKIENSSNTNAWLCSAVTWQFTETQDAR